MNYFRFYKNELPSIGDLVMCKVKQVNDINAYVDLLEYNISGSILLSELSRKSRVNVKKMIYEGKEEIYEVIKLDSDKKHIDLSKKNINVQEIEEFKSKYSKYRAIFNIMMKCSIEYKQDIDMLYREVVWILDEPKELEDLFTNNNLKESDPNDKTIIDEEPESESKDKISKSDKESENGSENGSESESESPCYDKFIEIANGNFKVLDNINLSDNVKNGLYDLISLSLKKKKMKIQSILQVKCHSKYGIIGIKNSLLETKKYCLEKYPDIELNIKYSSPEYVMYIITDNPNQASVIINEMIEFLNNYITTCYKGYIKVDKYPYIVENQKNNN